MYPAGSSKKQFGCTWKTRFDTISLIFTPNQAASFGLAYVRTGTGHTCVCVATCRPYACVSAFVYDDRARRPDDSGSVRAIYLGLWSCGF